MLCTFEMTILSLLHSFLDKLEFNEKFDTKVEFIYGRLLPWYQDKDVAIFIVF